MAGKKSLRFFDVSGPKNWITGSSKSFGLLKAIASPCVSPTNAGTILEIGIVPMAMRIGSSMSGV
jgi:hypothetical protein